MSAGQEPEEAGQLAGKQCAHAKKRSVMKSTVDKWIACRERQRLKYFRVAEVRYRPRRPYSCGNTEVCDLRAIRGQAGRPTELQRSIRGRLCEPTNIEL